MDIRTHQTISRTLCGVPREMTDGYSRVVLTTTGEMTVDDRGLVHGGFIFGLADHAAMIAVNDPHVVLASSSVKFLKPVSAGEEVEAEAVVRNPGEKRQTVSVTVRRGETTVMMGEFLSVVLDRHVLDI